VAMLGVGGGVLMNRAFTNMVGAGAGDRRHRAGRACCAMASAGHCCWAAGLALMAWADRAARSGRGGADHRGCDLLATGHIGTCATAMTRHGLYPWLSKPPHPHRQRRKRRIAAAPPSPIWSPTSGSIPPRSRWNAMARSPRARLWRGGAGRGGRSGNRAFCGRWRRGG
jgi:hypothetical protein